MSFAGALTAPRRSMLRDAVLMIARLGMAAVFIVAALPKIAAPDAFAANVHNYQLLPPWGVNVVALVLPWLELVLGVCLALGAWTRASALTMAILMIVFIAAFASATARGLNISCGCFEVGEGHATPVLQVLLRDAAFLAGAALLVFFPHGPSLFGLARRVR